MARDEDLFDDELEDEEEEEEYEFEEEEEEEDGEDEGFEEFEDDFETAGPKEVKVKTVSGMDTFALGWAFFATLGGICLATWLILYEVYDWRAFDVLPRKEAPIYPQQPFEVIGIGRDPSVSDTSNYLVVRAGTLGNITPGTVLHVFGPGSGSDWLLQAVVSEECEGRVAKAWIVDARSPLDPPRTPGQVISASDFRAIPSKDSALALRNIWLVRGDLENAQLTARAAPWNEQRITRMVRDSFGDRR